MQVDPHDPANHGKPLWVVYGSTAFPSILCCRLRINDGHATMWGYSVWRRSPGFRTMGTYVKNWIASLEAKREDLYEFYDDQEEALDRLRKILTPTKKALEA